MDRKISDEQIDRIAKNLLKDFALSDEKLDEIAESPQLWRNVRRQIEAENERRARSWFAAFRSPVLAFGALAMFICFGLAALFLNSKKDSISPIAEQKNVQEPKAEIAQNANEPISEPVKDEVKNPSISKAVKPVPAKVSIRNAEPKANFAAKNQKPEVLTKDTENPSKISPKSAVEETKTDFIALSYAANSESGQIVRVKVPSAMMVSLGVKSSVEKESELVNAEVVIGDDGLARAIRFIR